jgi:hypothetical protein
MRGIYVDADDDINNESDGFWSSHVSPRGPTMSASLPGMEVKLQFKLSPCAAYVLLCVPRLARSCVLLRLRRVGSSKCRNCRGDATKCMDRPADGRAAPPATSPADLRASCRETTRPDLVPQCRVRSENRCGKFVHQMNEDIDVPWSVICDQACRRPLSSRNFI